MYLFKKKFRNNIDKDIKFGEGARHTATVMGKNGECVTYIECGQQRSYRLVSHLQPPSWPWQHCKRTIWVKGDSQDDMDCTPKNEVSTQKWAI